MNLFEMFSRKAPNKLLLAIILGSLAGVAYSLLIPLILLSLTDETEFVTVDSQITEFLGFEVANVEFAQTFLWVCLFILIARTTAQIILTRLSLDVTADLRKQIYDRIAGAPLVNLENVGSARLLATITQDVERIMFGAKLLPDLVISLVTVVSMLSFLLFLNHEVFWFVLGSILFGMVTYQVPMLIGRRYFIKGREYLDDLHEAIRGLIYGAKELKLNDERWKHYQEHELLKAEYGLIGAQKTGLAIVRAAMNYGDLISFFVIGVLTFIFINYSAISNQQLVGVVMALLYITGPVTAILNVFPEIAMAKVSIKKVEKLKADLPQEPGKKTLVPLKPWQYVKFENLEFVYPNQGEDSNFKLGPVSLEIHKGQTTFIVGGNGSGKSTLSKMLTLHYLPTSGQIHFGDQLVTADSLYSWRQNISAIYTDYYLFKTLLGVGGTASCNKINDYLKKLNLHEKVTIDNGHFSTLQLSDGQRKRLALLVAYMEDKDLYLFDEWAADQDPDFKQFFYYELLPELKSLGKAVIVISHDDRYFHLADQIIVMENGLRKSNHQYVQPAVNIQSTQISSTKQTESEVC